MDPRCFLQPRLLFPLSIHLYCLVLRSHTFIYPCFSIIFGHVCLTQSALLWVHQCMQIPTSSGSFKRKLGHLTKIIILSVSSYFEALNLFINNTCHKLAVHKYFLWNLSLYFHKTHSWKINRRHIFSICFKLKIKDL